MCKLRWCVNCIRLACCCSVILPVAVYIEWFVFLRPRQVGKHDQRKSLLCACVISFVW